MLPYEFASENVKIIKYRCRHVAYMMESIVSSSLGNSVICKLLTYTRKYGLFWEPFLIGQLGRRPETDWK